LTSPRTTAVLGPAARDAIAAIASDFVEFGADVVSPDPLDWDGYGAHLQRARKRSGEPESVVCGYGRVGRTESVLVSFDFRFMGGSMGEATGRKITEALVRAREDGRPFVSLVCSGGCRMQEGMRALVQMQRISAAAGLARSAGVPHVSVLRSPTTGGVWAALCAAADVILAVPDATVAFAGHRVRGSEGSDTQAFTSTGKALHGQVDQVLEETELVPTLATLLELMTPAGAPVPAPMPFALGRTDLPPDGWEAVRRARSSERPRADAYLDAYFEERIAISGDRAGGVDETMRCGIGRHRGKPIAYVAQTGTANTPAGFRTAARLIRLADRVGLPILTLIDTPGAANDAAAERGAIGAAIAEAFEAVADASVPITSLVIGEGGSGGALALASHTDLWIAPDAYFAVISPEAAAAILKQPRSKERTIAGRLRLRPQDLLDLGVVHGIASPAGVA
jgi:acyl-CoA carboxylase subunit beta